MERVKDLLSFIANEVRRRRRRKRGGQDD